MSEQGGLLYNGNKKEKVLQIFNQYFRDFCGEVKQRRSRELSEKFLTYRHKINMEPPLYEIILLNKNSFIAFNFYHINFQDKKVIVEANLYTRGYNNDENGNGQKGFEEMEKFIQNLANILGMEIYLLLDANKISEKLSKEHGFKRVTNDEINYFEKFVGEFRGVPKNSLLRLENIIRDQIPSISLANNKGLKYIISKSSELPIEFKEYHQEKRIIGERFDLQVIQSDINQIKNSIGTI